MSIQNDNTLVTKGDLKNLYTDKIAPYLGGGINYYYSDRTGEELLHGNFALANRNVNAHSTSDTNSITVSHLGLIPFVKTNGNIQPGTQTGTFQVPDGKTVEIKLDFTTQNTANVRVWLWNYTDDVQPEGDVNNWHNSSAYSFGGQGGNSGYAMPSSGTFQWTNNTGHTVDLGFKIDMFSGSSAQFRVDAATMTVQEIGRIIDPVKYVSNNSDLQETPVGNIISYMGNNVPKHYLACDGILYSIGTYPELEAFIINEFGSINYFGGNGSTTWAVPDLRGEFLRGAGENSHTNNGSGANVGVHQDATQHLTVKGFGSANYLGIGMSDSGSNYDSTIKGNNYIRKGGTSTSEKGDNYYTSRPTNTSVKYCIKYESTFHAFFSNAAYKVSAAFDLAWGGNTDNYVLDAFNDIKGDSSLIDGAYFKAPVDGLYAVSFNSGQESKSKKIVQYIQVFRAAGDRIDFTDGSNSDTADGFFGINANKILYLYKGDKINLRMWTSGSQITLPINRFATFALITSNYNPTIVSTDSVYSENEQMVGYWTDGKPLYQKTISATSQPNINSWGNGYEIGASVDTIVKVSGRLVLDNNAGTYTGNFALPTVNNDDSIIYIGTNNNHSSLPNRVGVRVGKVEYTSRPISITVQYTKTTDTASSLQVENSLLLNRPDLWTPGTEYHFGGGLYGIRKTGTITAAIDERVWTAIVTISSGNLPSIVDSGGWIKWGDEGTHDYKYSINSTLTGLTGWGNTLGAWSVMRTGDTQIALWNTSGLARTNAPYDVWVTYRK